MKAIRLPMLTKILLVFITTFLTSFINAETSVEVKLQAYFEEDRGWCLDLRGPPQRAQPLGGIHGHTCYLYDGTVSLDQGYVKEDILGKNIFRLAAFPDQCMTLYEPKSGSFVSMETCDGRITQEISLNENGRVSPKMAPDLCLTIGTETLPGGGGTPMHILRSATFDTCDDSIADRQKWELRAEWNGLAEATEPRTWEPTPRQRGAGGGGGTRARN